MKYEVTIGIPIYNVEKYIRQTLDSALAQTFESIEFLILDDCGTDNSIDIVREYQNMNSRGKDIRIVRQPQNGGIGLARNRIIEEAQGRYLFFLDADDTIASETIKLLYNSAVKYDADMVYGSYQRIEEYGNEIKKINYCYPDQQFLSENEFAERVYREYGFLQANVWNILIRIDIIRTNHLWFKTLNFWEDFILTIDLPTYVTRVVLLPDITYYYYCRNNSLSNFQKRKRISKQEIMTTIQAMDDVKVASGRLQGKNYFPLRMQKVMMTDLYIVCSILRNKAIITPPFSKREIRDVMWSPLSLKEICGFPQAKLTNLILYSFGKLPPALSVMMMKLLAKIRKLI